MWRGLHALGRLRRRDAREPRATNRTAARTSTSRRPPSCRAGARGSSPCRPASTIAAGLPADAVAPLLPACTRLGRSRRRAPRGQVAMEHVLVIGKGVHGQDGDARRVAVGAGAVEIDLVRPRHDAVLREQPRRLRVVRVGVVPPAPHRPAREPLERRARPADRPAALPARRARGASRSGGGAPDSSCGWKASQPWPPISTFSIDSSGSRSPRSSTAARPGDEQRHLQPVPRRDPRVLDG